ncbi:MAG TPA: DUF3795 domain-containing protein [Methanomassiliicoccales archaeon]|jgi:hypothetical protein|nr:DUF3795 domain-containing protein [Methanomassiliicoccales archaeon]
MVVAVDKDSHGMAYCGYRCDLCPALKATRSDDVGELAQVAKEWKKLYGFNLKPEEVRCAGCRSDGPRVDKHCPVRPCCIKKDIGSCGECDDFPCKKIKPRLVSRERIEGRLGSSLGDDEYRAFVHPYESRQRLEDIRNKQGSA